MKFTVYPLLFRSIDRPLFWRLVSPFLDLLCVVHKSPKWMVFSGFAHERFLSFDAACRRYTSAVLKIRKTDDIRSLRWLQAAQFFQERSRFLMGKEHADDPLFVCSVVDIQEMKNGNDRQKDSAGFFRAEFVFSGLQIHGFLPACNTGSVDLFLDGVTIRNINATGKGKKSAFSFRITRSALKYFPSNAELVIKTREGAPLTTFSGASRVNLIIPHGIDSGSPILSGEKKIDKKGTLVPTPEELEGNRKRYLEVYADARRFFSERLGKDLFLAYGTLLGCYRQGGFIPGDDDFDTGFMASSSDPLKVKKETIAMVIDLVKAGFTVSFNRRGRLFRLHGRGREGQGTHLDVHSFWIEENLVWAHNDYCAPGTRSDFIPVRDTVLNGVTVGIPANPEVYLSSHYGPGWKTPDPGFINYYTASKTAVLKNLSRALISPGEYRAVQETLSYEKQFNPGIGSFISIGQRDLYPLPEMDEDLE